MNLKRATGKIGSDFEYSANQSIFLIKVLVVQEDLLSITDLSALPKNRPLYTKSDHNAQFEIGYGSESKLFSMIATALIVIALAPSCVAILAVQKNELRSADTLDGLWTFVREQTNSADVGMNSSWYAMDLAKFAFFNSQEVGSHVGGHLPFQFDVTRLVKFGTMNKVTVAVNNTLSWSTIPQGDFNYMKDTTRFIDGRNISRTPNGAFKNVGNFDFFNYAGILRSVYLVKLPPSHIVDVWIIAEHLGSFSYEVTLSQNRSDEDVIVRMLDPDGVTVYSARGLEQKGSLSK
ncbi:glycosyl hydrolase family 2, sugar binding domain protein, partial [Teladorsagia circumcincta]